MNMENYAIMRCICICKYTSAGNHPNIWLQQEQKVAVLVCGCLRLSKPSFLLAIPCILNYKKYFDYLNLIYDEKLILLPALRLAV